MADQQILHLVSVDRIVRLPIVETSWNIAADIYTRIKNSNSLVSWGLNTAESTVQAAFETTLPAVVALERPIAIVDSLLCKSLDIVEERIPVVTLPPALIYENTKEYVSNVIMVPVLRRADNVKRFGLNKANSAVLRLDSVIDEADKYVDQYLPGTVPEENHETNNVVGSSKNSQAMQTLHRADRLSRKLQRRITQHTLAEVKAMRQYSKDALDFVLLTLELLVKDPKALKEKIVALWLELSQDEPENQKRPANLEELTMLVTRELARRVVHLANYLRAGVAALPQNIAHSMHVAADYCIHLADVIVKTAHLGGPKDAAIARARIELQKIQVILNDINAFSSQLLEMIALQIARNHDANKKATQKTHNCGHHCETNNLNAVD
jgi:hypothetical protein